MIKQKAWVLVSVLLVAAVLLSGCGAKSNEESVFGLVLVGPYNDHGWSEAHYRAAEAAVAELPNSKFIHLDKLNPADRAGTTLEQVVDDMVSEGATLIFTTSDDFAVDTDSVAAKYPDIQFVHISGDHAKTGKAPGNVSNFMARMEYTKAIAGCAAALKTETGAIGYLGPVINDETRRLASSASLGARECYELYRGQSADDLRFVVTWIGFWFNIPGVTLDPTEVANDLFNSGVDVLMSGIDTTEAIVVAGQRFDQGETVWAVPYDYEGACEVKPEVCLGVPYFNWKPFYIRTVEAVRKDKDGLLDQTWVWESPVWKSFNDNEVSAVGFDFGPALNEQDTKNIEDYIQRLANGESKLFVGPLNLQDGTPYLAAGEQATDDQIWYLPQLLEGMEGASN
jgi:simple sugar transport system substrate-binding protein